LEGPDGEGLLIESLWWQANIPPLPFPPTQPATLEIRATDGPVLAEEQLTVLSWDDVANVQEVTVYFLLDEELQAVTRVVPRTVRIGTAALEELLWGPPPPNAAGFITALPLPSDVLAYPGQGPDWGPRVRLLELTIEDSVATANFSREFRAYGGGSLRVTLIREQITRTLLEFPTVQEVVIAVEGETEGVLEP
jgi:spore germination protein GerM